MNHLEHFLLFASTASAFVSLSTFASLVSVPMKILSSAVGLKIYALTAGIKKYKSIIQKKMKNHDKIVLFAKKDYHYFDF